jgi:hypothetical protein
LTALHHRPRGRRHIAFADHRPHDSIHASIAEGRKKPACHPVASLRNRIKRLNVPRGRAGAGYSFPSLLS